MPDALHYTARGANLQVKHTPVTALIGWKGKQEQGACFMDQTKLYRDIAGRCDGDIYLGVVGPVRTGKSTLF